MNTEKKRIFVLLMAVLGVGLTLLSSEIVIKPAYAATFGRVNTLIQTTDGEYFPELDRYIMIDGQGGDVTSYEPNGNVDWALTSGFTLPRHIYNYEGAIIVLGSTTVYEIDEDGFISRSVALGWTNSNAEGAIRENILYVTRPDTDTIYRVNLDTFALGSTTSITANCDSPSFWVRYISDIDGFVLSCGGAATPRQALYSSSWTYIDHVATAVSQTATHGEVDIAQNEIWTNSNDDLTIYSYNATDISLKSVESTSIILPFALNGNYLYAADPTRDNMLVYSLLDESLIAAFALNWDNETFAISDISIADDNQDELFLGINRSSSLGYMYFTPYASLLSGITIPVPSGGSVDVDNNGDGVADFELVDVDGDGMVDWDPTVVPIQAENFAESATNFVQSFGFEPEVAGLLIAGFIVIVAEGVLFAATGRDGFMGVPAFVHGILVFVGVGVSTALGFIDLFYIYILAALVAIALGFTVARGTGGAAD